MAISAPPIARGIARDASARRVVLAVGAAAFLTSFDASAVNASLPLLRETFAASIERIHWVLTAGLLVNTALLLVFGRLGDLVGHRRVYRAGPYAFLTGCVLCATAGSLTSLIAARGLQAAGAAMLLATSPALLAKHLPAGRRGPAFGMKAACLYLGLIAGPVLGGWMAGRFGWRAVFWIQLPLLAAVAPAVRFIPPDAPIAGRRRFDFAGAVVWACIPGALVLWLGPNGPASPGGISRAWMAAALLALVAGLIAIERRSPNPMIDLACFRRVPFSASAAGLLAAFAASYILSFALPFYIVEVRRQSHAVIGPLLALISLARAVTAFVSGRWSDRLDPRWLTVSGMLLLAASLAFLSRAGEHAPVAAFGAALLTAGVAMGVFVPANNSALMGYAPRDRYGAAAGILTTSRTAGMSAGVALAGAILSSTASPASNMRLAFTAAMLLAIVAAAASWLAPPDLA